MQGLLGQPFFVGARRLPAGKTAKLCGKDRAAWAMQFMLKATSAHLRWGCCRRIRLCSSIACYLRLLWMPAVSTLPVADKLCLPCQPRVLALLMRELLSAVPNMRRVNQLFGADPVLAAQLMACANAHAYQMAGAVRGIPQAVTLLGDRQLRALVNKAQTAVASRAMAGLDMALFARTSHASAKLARSLAALTGLDSSAAYVTGLLHGMGHLFMQQTQGARMVALQAEADIWDPRRPRVEMRHWGYSANSSTAALLRQWNVPTDMVAAVQAMEAPMACEHFEPLAGVLHLAVWCQRAKHSGWTQRQMADAFPVDVALALGIDVDVVLQQEATDWRQSMY